MVVSDHSPCTADLKLMDAGDFLQAWGGISSLQFGRSQLMCSVSIILVAFYFAKMSRCEYVMF